MNNPCAHLTLDECNELYNQVIADKDIASLRRLCKVDLFFLLTRAFKRNDVSHPWLFARCREIEQDPDNNLDLWAREHYKSTIITYGKTIQDILCNPDLTVGIFSHTRPIAKAFLEQIKREFEANTFLQDLFPDILYKDPKRESPKWSLDSGIIVKRTTNPKEATVEAWGLTDGQPTSKHFTLVVYDDVVTRDSVTTPEMIKKVTEAWELSLSLGAQGGRVRYIGTRYHQTDTYSVIIDRKAVKKVRIHTPTDQGQNDLAIHGNSVLIPKNDLESKRRKMGPYTYGCQMLQNPQADNVMGFKKDWLMFYDYLRNHENWNYYLICDPASEKKKTSDYTVMLVIGLAPDMNYYLVDGLRDRLNLNQRTEKYIGFHRKWKPKECGYEKYGKDSDIEHIKGKMEDIGYRFEITALGGNVKKNDRIRGLVPLFENKTFYLPHNLYYIDYQKKMRDLIEELIKDEYLTFPVCSHDDILDCAARIRDPNMKIEFPKFLPSKYMSITQHSEPDMARHEESLFT